MGLVRIQRTQEQEPAAIGTAIYRSPEFLLAAVWYDQHSRSKVWPAIMRERIPVLRRLDEHEIEGLQKLPLQTTKVARAEPLHAVDKPPGNGQEISTCQSPVITETLCERIIHAQYTHWMRSERSAHLHQPWRHPLQGNVDHIVRAI